MKMMNEVICGDALEQLQLLDDNCIDITVTSPPYNKKRSTFGWLVQTNRYADYNDSLPEDKYQEWQLAIINELFRVTKPGGSLFYNHKLRWSHGELYHPVSWIAKSEWTFRQEIIWDRSIAANIRGWRFYQIDERIYWLYKPIDGHLVGKELESRHAKMSSIWKMKPVKRSPDHPAPFPLILAARAIYSMPKSSEQVVVADPFCGTGTTLVAAKLLGHNYFGVDVSEQYVELARNRITNSESELEDIKKEMSKHVVKDPYKARKKRGTVNWPFAPKSLDGSQEAVSENSVNKSNRDDKPIAKEDEQTSRPSSKR